jgi:hypothetical protein
MSHEGKTANAQQFSVMDIPDGYGFSICLREAPSRRESWLKLVPDDTTVARLLSSDHPVHRKVAEQLCLGDNRIESWSNVNGTYDLFVYRWLATGEVR